MLKPLSFFAVVLNILASHSLPRFAVSGLLITIVSLAITAIVLAVGGGRALAVSLGYVISSLLGYFLHSLVSFRHSLSGRLVPVRSYFTLLVVSGLMAYIGSGVLDSLFSGSTIALALAIGLPVLVNYFLWRFLIDRQH